MSQYIFEARFMFYKEKKIRGETLLHNKLITCKKIMIEHLLMKKTSFK